MINIGEIRAMETTFDGLGKFHESVTRSYHILSAVKYYLGEKVPPHIILELIEEMEGKNKVRVYCS